MQSAATIAQLQTTLSQLLRSRDLVGFGPVIVPIEDAPPAVGETLVAPFGDTLVDDEDSCFLETDASGQDERPWMGLLTAAFNRQRERLRTQEHVATLLSDREQEVLGWFAEGKSAEDVAGILGISPATVMFHYRKAAERMGTLNRTHTVVEAYRRGSLHSPLPTRQ